MSRSLILIRSWFRSGQYNLIKDESSYNEWNRCYSYRKTVSKIESKYWFRICDWSRLLLTLYPSHVFVYLKHVSAPEIKFSHCAKTWSVQRGIKWGVRKYLVFRQPKGWKKNRNKEIFLTCPTHWQYEIYHKRHGLNCGWHKSLLFRVQTKSVTLKPIEVFVICDLPILTNWVEYIFR